MRFTALKSITLAYILTSPLCLFAANIKQPSSVSNEVVTNQENNSEYLLNLSLEELLNVTVTIASRTEKSVSTAPSSVTIYLRQDILNMGLKNLDDLLNFVPGVYSNRDDVRGQRAIFRGHKTGDCSNGVLVLLNGSRGNNALCGGAFEHLSYLSLMDIERVEVIRGPGSAMYGSNAMIGVINVITRKTGNEFNLSTGSIGFREAGVKLTKSIGEMDVSIFARYAEEKGKYYEPFYNYFGELLPTKDPRKAIDITGHFKIGELTINTTYIHRKNGEYISSAGGFGDLEGNVHSDNTRYSFDVNYSLDISKDVNVDIYANSHYYDNVWTSIIIPSGVASQIVWSNGADVDYIGGNTVEGNELQLGFNGAWKSSEYHVLSFGSNYRKENNDRNSFHGNYDNALQLSSNGALHNPLPNGEDNVGFYGGIFGLPFGPEIYLIDATSREAYGGYIQSEYQMTETINITGGLRFDDYQDTGSNISIRGSLVYVPKPDTTIKAMFGQAYRAPSIHEFYGQPAATGAIGNPNLGPETVDTIELSISQKLGDAQLSLTWFNNSFKDGIQNVQIDDVVPGIDTFQAQNIGKLKTSGWEAELYYQITENFAARGGLSYLSKLDELGVAQTSGYWAFNYHYGHWNFNLNGYYRGSIQVQKANAETMTAESTINAYTHWNAKFSYYISDNIELYGMAQNLFDKEYRNYTVITDLLEGVPMRDRIIKVGISWKF